VRFYFRTRAGGVSVGIIGALVLLVLVAALWFYIALAVVAVLVLAGIAYAARAVWQRARRR
jgi:hypothetical protein